MLYSVIIKGCIVGQVSRFDITISLCIQFLNACNILGMFNF